MSMCVWWHTVHVRATNPPLASHACRLGLLTKTTLSATPEACFVEEKKQRDARFWDFKIKQQIKAPLRRLPSSCGREALPRLADKRPEDTSIAKANIMQLYRDSQRNGLQFYRRTLTPACDSMCTRVTLAWFASKAIQYFPQQ